MFPVGSSFVWVTDEMSTFLGGRVLQVVWQQFISASSEYYYILKPTVGMHFPIQFIAEATILSDLISRKRSLVKIPEQNISYSTMQRDVYLDLLSNEATSNIPHLPQLDCYLTAQRTGLSKECLLRDFCQRFSNTDFLYKQRNFLEKSHNILLQFPVVPPHLQWKLWNPYGASSLQHKFFFLALIQFAIVQGDESLKRPLIHLFDLTYVRDDGSVAKYDCVKSMACRPNIIFNFFKTRSMEKTLLCAFDGNHLMVNIW